MSYSKVTIVTIWRKMKIRAGFVSNSSSASFVIERRHVSDGQLKQLKDHILYMKRDKKYSKPCDAWKIIDFIDYIKGSTSMTNISREEMETYIESLGIDRRVIDWVE